MTSGSTDSQSANTTNKPDPDEVTQPARHPATATARVIQAIGCLICRALARFLYRCTIRFDVPLPPAPLLLAANHRSFLDPPAIGMCLRDPIAYFARSSLWKAFPSRIMLNIMRSIPVERENPGSSSMKGAIERLKQGISVLVFPEGTRTPNGRIGRLREGPALFARRAGVPIVPVYLFRSDDAWPRGKLLPRLGGARVSIRFGRPIIAPEGLSSRERDAWVTRRIDAWMRLAEARAYGERPRSPSSPALVAKRKSR
jgi:1-acyl-sn-glycerol-3-phosphate acyltransferase